MNDLVAYLICYLSVRKLAIGAAVLVAVAVGSVLMRRRGWVGRLAEAAALIYMALQVGLAVHLFLNHLQFPLVLGMMEGVTAMHLERLGMGLPLYVAPSAAFVPLAYNPGFYVACLPVYAFVGDPLVTMRLVAGLAWLALGGLVGYVMHTSGARRGVTALAVGAYFSAYMVFDAYLDTGHPDSLLLLLVVSAWTVMWRHPTRRGRLVAIAMLVLAFWVKQHGAIFVLGALVYVTFEERSWRVWPYWAVAGVAGAGAYLLLGPALFGPEFHHYTYAVPSSWSRLSGAALARLTGYGLLWLPSAVLAWQWWRNGTRLHDPWTWGLVCAAGAGLLGVMDGGSSDNILIAFGLWWLVLGALGLGIALPGSGAVRRTALLGAYVLQLTVLLYHPGDVLTDANAHGSYRDLVGAMAHTRAPIYALQMGRLPASIRPAAQAGWVPLADMTRGTTNGRYHALTRDVLAPLASRPVCLLTNWPLEHDTALGFLLENFQQVDDFGSRFRPLRILPTRFGSHWPRYLYANRLALAAAAPPGRLTLLGERRCP